MFVQENTIGERKFDKNTHPLILKKITYNSPLDLSIIVPLAASIAGIPYLILKSIEKINDIRIKSEKHKYNIEQQKLEIEKLKVDIQEKRKDRFQISDKNMDLIFSNIITSKRFLRIIKKWDKLPFKFVMYEVQFGVID